MKEILLPRPLVVRLLTLAQHHADSIVRGVLGARNGEPEGVVVANGNSEALFDIPESELHQAIQELSEQGQLLYAVFESHPVTVMPQRDDMARFNMPGLLYLVISLGTKGVLEMQGWRLEDEQPQAVQIGIREVD
jgi:hypothetical protein